VTAQTNFCQSTALSHFADSTSAASMDGRTDSAAAVDVPVFQPTQCIAVAGQKEPHTLC